MTIEVVGLYQARSRRSRGAWKARLGAEKSKSFSLCPKYMQAQRYTVSFETVEEQPVDEIILLRVCAQAWLNLYGSHWSLFDCRVLQELQWNSYTQYYREEKRILTRSLQT